MFYFFRLRKSDSRKIKKTILVQVRYKLTPKILPFLYAVWRHCSIQNSSKTWRKLIRRCLTRAWTKPQNANSFENLIMQRRAIIIKVLIKNSTMHTQFKHFFNAYIIRGSKNWAPDSTRTVPTEQAVLQCYFPIWIWQFLLELAPVPFRG